MSQNTSSAVMQQRNADADPFDYYPTQPWATRALIEQLQSYDFTPEMVVSEPACGEGYMTRPLQEYFHTVHAMDIQDMGHGEVGDYLFKNDLPIVDWTITNPPFKLAEQFIFKALDLSTVGVAMFVRAAFEESVGRYERLFKNTPPTDKYVFTERVPLFRGRVDPSGGSATAYSWMVWRKRAMGPQSNVGTLTHWIPPCRKRLERSEDYPPVEQEPIETTPLFGDAA